MLLYVLAIVSALLIYMWKMRKFYYASFNMKGPTTFPLIGNCLDFLATTEEMYNKLEDLVKTYGTPFRIWIGTNFTVVLTHPEDYKILLNSPNALAKPTTMYGLIFDVTQNSVFSLNEISRWRLHRKLLESTFKANVLKSFIPTFEKNALMLCDKLGEETGNGVIDIDLNLMVCTLNTLLETAMGTERNINLDMKKYAIMILEGIGMIANRLFCVWQYPDFIYMLTKTGKYYKKQKEKVQAYHKMISEMKESEYWKSKQETVQNKQNVFLNYLVEISHETEHYAKEEVKLTNDSVNKGSHTTARTGCVALMLLGMHPEIQDKVYDELQDIFGDSERAITKEDLDNMNYLQRVIKEAMRLFPLAPVIGRNATHDIQLSTCSLPKGTDCVLPIIHVHRDPKIWPNPLKFDADRFLPAEVAKRHPYAWIPFSAGPRNCIGLKYAMMAMKVMLSSIIRRYKIHCDYKSVEEIKLKIDITVMPVEGFRVALEARTAEK